MLFTVAQFPVTQVVPLLTLSNQANISVSVSVPVSSAKVAWRLFLLFPIAIGILKRSNRHTAVGEEYGVRGAIGAVTENYLSHTHMKPNSFSAQGFHSCV